MTTLLELVAPQTEVLSGVKRTLTGAPVNIPYNQPGFRGTPNEPSGDSIKAPKLDTGNRVTRGTNITVPYARITPVDSIDVFSGRLSPGDVVFIRRDPTGYVASPPGSFGGNPSGGNYMYRKGPLDAHSHGSTVVVKGLNAVNEELCGDLAGSKPWRLGFNLVRNKTKKQLRAFSNLFKDLKTLGEYTLDGVIMSSDAQQAYQVTNGQNNSVLFNVAIQGPAQTNNGFMAYKSHEASPVYARIDPSANMRPDPSNLTVTSEHANGTWHGRIGANDYVAALTNTYTEFPKQMFDRRARVMDKCYLVIRAYNLGDVVEERAKVLKRENENIDAAISRILTSIKIVKDDGVTKVAATTTNIRTMWFVQYMPTTSRSIQTARHIKSLKAKLGDDGKLSPLFKHAFTHGNGYKSKQIEVPGATDLPISVPWVKLDMQTDRMATVRTEDVDNIVGAWMVGSIIDTNSSSASVHQHGPLDASFRINVNVDIKFMPYQQRLGEEDAKLGKDEFQLVWRGIVNADEDNAKRNLIKGYMGAARRRSFCEAEALKPSDPPDELDEEQDDKAEEEQQEQEENNVGSGVGGVGGVGDGDGGDGGTPAGDDAQADITKDLRTQSASLAPLQPSAGIAATAGGNKNKKTARPSSSLAATASAAPAVTTTTKAAVSSTSTHQNAASASASASAAATTATATTATAATAAVAPITESVLRRAAAGERKKTQNSVVNDVFAKLMGETAAGTAGAVRAVSAVSPTPSNLSSNDGESAPKTFSRKSR